VLRSAWSDRDRSENHRRIRDRPDRTV